MYVYFHIIEELICLVVKFCKIFQIVRLEIVMIKGQNVTFAPTNLPL